MPFSKGLRPSQMINDEIKGRTACSHLTKIWPPLAW